VLSLRQLAARIRIRYRTGGAGSIYKALKRNIYWNQTFLHFSIALARRDRALGIPPGFESHPGRLKELSDFREAWLGLHLSQEFYVVYAHVLADNCPSIRAFTAADFQPIATVTWQRFLGVRRVVNITHGRSGGSHVLST
jgi:hypothetical protein